MTIDIEQVSGWLKTEASEAEKELLEDILIGMQELSVGSTRGTVKREDGRFVSGVRSEPGQGESIEVTVMGEPVADCSDPDDFHWARDGIYIVTTYNEDFAKCTWPIVVKVKEGTDRKYVAKAMRVFAERILMPDYVVWDHVRVETVKDHEDSPF